MHFAQKVIDWDRLAEWRQAVRQSGKRLVVTNGCFDLLHIGHVTYLEEARNHGDALLIGLNSDDSVRQLKGSDRPINQQADRAAVLAALESVDAVCVFSDVNAARFLSVAQPDVYAKGGDYTVETLNQTERQIVEQNGGKVVILPVVPGKSTTSLLKKIATL